MTPKYYYAQKNTVGLGEGYQIWWENLRGKSMGPVRMRQTQANTTGGGVCGNDSLYKNKCLKSYSYMQ